AGRDQLAVAAKRQTVDLAAMPLQVVQEPSAGAVPDVDPRLLAVRQGQAVAGRTPGHRGRRGVGQVSCDFLAVLGPKNPGSPLSVATHRPVRASQTLTSPGVRRKASSE